ncbi:MAG: MFS transporter [Phycisphaerae bacterium]|nr:MFS transporter [Phycisphaerae bacterium]
MFAPRSLPRRARPDYTRELVSWSILPLVLGAIEGGTMSIVVQKAFDGAPGVGPASLNLALSAVIATPEFANVASFIWAAFAFGRRKVRLISTLQRGVCVLVAAMALLPTTEAGLWALCGLYLLARSMWTGVITLRAAVWRGNYEKSLRAKVAGRMATVQSLVLAATGLLIGLAMDFDERAFHFLFPVLALAGLAGNAVYRRVRLRGEPALLERERRGAHERPSLGPRSVVEVLRHDRAYRRFMGWMFVFGLGNLLVSFPFTKAFEGASYLEGILVRTTLPYLVMPLAIPFWAPILARRHVIEFRAMHAWSFVAATFALVLASVTGERWIYYLASAMLGFAFAGGALAWNIGHSDFAPPERDSLYMSVHVTLNGLRGLISPFLAFALWAWLEPRGLFPVVFLVCLAINTIGAIGFVRMAMSRRRVLRAHAVPVASVPVAGGGAAENESASAGITESSR